MPLEVAQAKAELVTEELRRLGWQEAQLASRRKRDPSNLAIAVRLRKETTFPSNRPPRSLTWAHRPARASACWPH